MTDYYQQPRRVVVTGMAAITPLGNTLADFRAALAAARPAISRAPESLPTDFVSLAESFSGSIDDFGELAGERKKAVRKALKLMCRETQMAVAAAQMALGHARLDESSMAPEATGVVLGSDYMLTMPEDFVDSIKKCSAPAGEFDYAAWGTTGLGQMTPLWMLKYLPNMPASHIAIFNDLRGPNNSLTMREASSVLAIGEAFRTIARGHASVMLCGATGTRVLPLQAVHALQSEQMAAGDDPALASLPFDRRRTGMVAGEGAAVLVLEDREAATARGAKIYAEVLGQGSSLVADSTLGGRQQAAMSQAMRAALEDAKLAPSDIGHINTHGLATRESDSHEAAALADVFGDHARRVPVTALKSYFGNLGAGGGAAELIGSLLAAEAEQMAPTCGFAEADSDCPLRVATAAEPCPPATKLLKLSVTPQGQAAAIVLSLGG